MSDDLVTRLRNPHYDSSKTYELACEAADEIERLRAKVDAMSEGYDRAAKMIIDRGQTIKALRALLAEARAMIASPHDGDIDYLLSLDARIGRALRSGDDQ